MTAATDSATTAAPDVAKSYLSVNNIEVIYDHVILVLKGVSLEVPQGRIVALLGANGAGKTTTLKAVTGLARSAAGRIVYDGAEITGLRTRRRRSWLSSSILWNEARSASTRSSCRWSLASSKSAAA